METYLKGEYVCLVGFVKHKFGTNFAVFQKFCDFLSDPEEKHITLICFDDDDSDQQLQH